ncbi:transposase [Tepidibacter sp. Z1-5]|uniref:transposase n=1 Tax=Tepidibacter sp. Z1-5 TaxID=3134138 RepID=UPI0030BDDFBA
MMTLAINDKQKVLQAIQSGTIDAASISFPTIIDDILLYMNERGILKDLEGSIEDKRTTNKSIPLSTILSLAIAAKMKLKTALTDVPFAISDAQLLSALGVNIYDQDRDILTQGIYEEGVTRNLINKYTAKEFINFYNQYLNESILAKHIDAPTIHIFDCTKIQVNIKNNKYEKSEVVKIDGEAVRGYKLASLRGLLDVSGIIEEIEFGSIKTHDLELSRNLLLNTPHFKSGDILINDRGFISRDIINTLKIDKQVDIYVPAKKNMNIYDVAVSIAKEQDKWSKHPNKKRSNQTIQIVKDLGMYWEGDKEKEDVPINACVVKDIKNDEYYVFLTTDTSKTARQIIQIYELRPEIEEDFRQLKDFWNLEDFKSTKYNFILFHIVATLIGYSYFQIYINTEEGMKYQKKSLPIIIKNYSNKKEKNVVIYKGQYFGIFKFIEFLDLYATCNSEIRLRLAPVLTQV